MKGISIVSKIEKLTPEQIARFPEFRERWTKIGLCTDPADRPRAEAAIHESYRAAGLQPPRKIVWCGSPLSQGLTRAIILDNNKQLMASVEDSVQASVRDSVEASVRDSVGASVWASVGNSVWTSVWNSVWTSVRTSVGASVGDSVGDSVRASVWDSVYGQHDASWLAFYRYFKEVLQLDDQTRKLAGLWELAQGAGWALPHANICWVSERHNVLVRDDRGRLSNLAGPACAYPDGWAIYAVHGVRVPADVIETAADKFTRERLLEEPNAEIRRVLIERVGHERFLSLTEAKPIHDDRCGKLYRINLPNDEPIVLIEVVNSTPEPEGYFKHYFLRVPPQIATAREAVAWTFGMKAQEYLPGVET